MENFVNVHGVDFLTPYSYRTGAITFQVIYMSDFRNSYKDFFATCNTNCYW